MDKIKEKIAEFVDKYGVEDVSLVVERDDGEYDYKEFGLDQLEEARKYRSECSFRWMNHRDVMYIEKYDYDEGTIHREQLV